MIGGALSQLLSSGEGGREGAAKKEEDEGEKVKAGYEGQVYGEADEGGLQARASSSWRLVECRRGCKDPSANNGGELE